MSSEEEGDLLNRLAEVLALAASDAAGASSAARAGRYDDQRMALLRKGLAEAAEMYRLWAYRRRTE
jgi:hypothetical protein